MKSRRHVAVACAAALGVGALVLPQVVQGGVTTSFTERVPAGEIRLETDGGDSLTVVYAPVEGPEVVRSVTLRNRDKCTVDTSAFADLLVIGGPAAVGLVSNGLGSTNGNNCSSGNGRLDNGESITLALPQAFVNDGISIDAASVDVEGKFGAGLSVRTDDGTPFEVVLSQLSDNGNDSGPGDNNQVEVGLIGPGDDFVAITLSPTSDDGRGEIALEGGGDYATPTTNRTVLTLAQETEFEYALGCPTPESPVSLSEDIDPDTADLPPLFDPATTPLPGPDNPDVPVSATVIRYQNGSGKGGACEAIGADLTGEFLSASDLSVLFENTTASTQDIRLRIELTWYVVQTEGFTLADVPDREIDFLDGNGPQPGRACTSYDQGGASGPMDPTDPGLVERLDGVPWCLILDERTPATVDFGDGPVSVIVQRQVWDGAGDPRWL